MSSFFEKHYQTIGIQAPVCHFVLGSGFSPGIDKITKTDDFAKTWEERKAVAFKDVPGLPSPTVASHAGLYRFFVHRASGQSFSFQCGRVHLYEGHSPQTAAHPVMQIRLAGTKRFVLSNISGSLKKEHRPGRVIALKDHVNMTGFSPLTGPQPKHDLGPRFPDMAQVYSPDMTKKASLILTQQGLEVKPGIYVFLPGPELETPAQIRYLSHSSGHSFDVVGMSTIMEAIALKQAGASLAGFSLVANPATGVDPAYKEIAWGAIMKDIAPYVLKILKGFFKYAAEQTNS